MDELQIWGNDTGQYTAATGEILGDILIKALTPSRWSQLQFNLGNFRVFEVSSRKPCVQETRAPSRLHAKHDPVEVAMDKVKGPDKSKGKPFVEGSD